MFLVILVVKLDNDPQSPFLIDDLTDVITQIVRLVLKINLCMHAHLPCRSLKCPDRYIYFLMNMYGLI